MREKKTGFRATAAIKQQQQLTIMANLKMVCYYHFSCRELPVALVDCQMKVYKSLLNHVFQGEYVDMQYIDLDGAELNICHYCVDNIWMVVKPEKLKKAQHSTVYSTDESEEEKEEV